MNGGPGAQAGVPGYYCVPVPQRCGQLGGCACLGGSADAVQAGKVVFPAGDQVGAGFT